MICSDLIIINYDILLTASNVVSIIGPNKRFYYELYRIFKCDFNTCSIKRQLAEQGRLYLMQLIDKKSCTDKRPEASRACNGWHHINNKNFSAVWVSCTQSRLDSSAA